MNLLWFVFVYFFAIFGFVQMLMYIFDMLRCGEIEGEYNIVLTVKNQQEHIEAMVHHIAGDGFDNWRGRGFKDLIVVDMGSDDETPDILNKLRQEYEFLSVMDIERYIEHVSKSEKTISEITQSEIAQSEQILIQETVESEKAMTEAAQPEQAVIEETVESEETITEIAEPEQLTVNEPVGIAEPNEKS